MWNACPFLFVSTLFGRHADGEREPVLRHLRFHLLTDPEGSLDVGILPNVNRNVFSGGISHDVQPLLGSPNLTLHKGGRDTRIGHTR